MRTKRALLAVYVVLFAAGVALVSALHAENLLLTFLLAAALVFVLAAWRQEGDVHFFVVGAIIGTVGEVFAISAGAWSYANPTALGVPVWLPLAWGLGVMLIHRIVTALR